MNLKSISRDILTGLFFLTSFIFAQAQTDKTNKKVEIKNWYAMNASEMIFSGGGLEVNNATTSTGNILNQSPENVVRFSWFFHYQQQLHFNFNKSIGFYTGGGIRNIGFINTLSGLEEKIKIKQRCYSLGIPIAFKAGNMGGNYFAAGVEAELMFAYKRKVFYDGDKSKKSEWFSKDVNLFNPGVFAELHLTKGFYLRAKYYLFDFLSNTTESFVLPDDGRRVSYNVESSKLFYIAIGSTLKINKNRTRKPASTPTSI